MAIIRWDPWREIEDMFDRYTRAGGVHDRGAKHFARVRKTRV